jgi:UDP-MurNAc hydroxylase
MKISYLKSSSILIESNGIKILTDPWLTDGEYYGSWHHYPPFEFRKDYFEDVDYIYVSHIHMDHFSKATFALLNKSIPVLIHNYESKFLKSNIERLGFTVIELPHNERTHLGAGLFINILAADNCDPEHCLKLMGCGKVESKYGSTQIDTLCVIDNGKQSILNTNDCPFDLAKPTLNIVKNQYPQIDFLLVGYAGAGPFPQCFVLPENEMLEFGQKKKDQFLAQGLNFINEIRPKYVMPFAGTYVLGGKYAILQNFRGVPEIEEAASYFQNHINDETGVVLLNSYEFFDISNSKISMEYVPQDLLLKQKYIDEELSLKKYDYELDDMPDISDLSPLLAKSYERFEFKRVEINFKSQTVVLINLYENGWYLISLDGNGSKIISDHSKVKIEKFVSFTLDLRLLKRLLMGPKFAHWNNAEIGSHINFERRPNIFERGLYHSMCFFHN